MSPLPGAKWLKSLPDFETTLTALLRIPDTRESSFVATVVDHDHEITYRIASARVLAPSEVRRALVRAFEKLGNEDKHSVRYSFELGDLE